jgi:hypothetical protein
MVDGNGSRKVENLDVFNPPRIELTCGKCGTVFSVHSPQMEQSVTLVATVITITPSWSLNERICPGCKSVYAPAIKNVPEIVWSEVQIPEMAEQKRIIQPNGVFPPGIFRNLKGGRN